MDVLSEVPLDARSAEHSDSPLETRSAVMSASRLDPCWVVSLDRSLGVETDVESAPRSGQSWALRMD